MITTILTLEEFTQMFFETLFNKTSKVTKVSDGSVLNGVGFGIGKVAQKITKDVALVEAHMFPNSAYGIYLDRIAVLKGVARRLGASQSSTYIRLFGDPGTVYSPGIHTFVGKAGIVFDLEEVTTIPSFGFTYAKIRSQVSGLKANVDALSINKVNPIPSGHTFCINEYSAGGGRDVESDETFRQRLLEEINFLAKNSIAYLENIFRKINPNVLRVFHQGCSSNNEVILAISTVNGISLSGGELDDIKLRGQKFFSFLEHKPNNDTPGSYGIQLVNIGYQPIDISFRVDIDESYNVDLVRRDIQIGLNKELDYRFWNWQRKVEWDNLLQIVKSTTGVRYVPDNYFYPRVDISVNNNLLPRVRGFVMSDLDGNIITNLSGTLNPIFYSYYDNDFSLQSSVLASI